MINLLKLNGFVETEVYVETHPGYHGDFNFLHLEAGVRYYPWEEPKEDPEWVVEWEYPLAIRHKITGDTATGVFAEFIIKTFTTQAERS